MKTLADAFEHTLQDVYYAENAIAKALPKVIDAVSNSDLKTALKDHLVETKGQIRTLQAVFKSIGKKASGEKCDAIEGLIKETEGVIEEAKGAIARHAVIIGCCQAVEHYEIGPLRHTAGMGQGAGRIESARASVGNPRSGEGGQLQAHQHRHHRDQQAGQVIRGAPRLGRRHGRPDAAFAQDTHRPHDQEAS
jgi:ferritin-like metal-binding protein YciE